MNKYKTKVLTTQHVDTLSDTGGGVFGIVNQIPVPRSPFAAIMSKASAVEAESREVSLSAEASVRGSVYTVDAVNGGRNESVLPIDISDQAMFGPGLTLMVPDMDGFDENGSRTPGQALMLYVTGIDNASNNPIVHAVNGQSLPSIPEGALVLLLANVSENPVYGVASMSETVYLQRMAVPRDVADYVGAGFKDGAVPSSSVDFKSRMINTFIAGIPAKNDDGEYFTAGVRWQMCHDVLYSGVRQEGGLTIEKLIAAFGIFFREAGSVGDAVLFAGAGMVNDIQGMDFGNIGTEYAAQADGSVALLLHTAYGNVSVLHEPALDRLGWTGAGMLISPSALTLYTHRDGDGTEYGAVVADGRFGIWLSGDSWSESRNDAIRTMLWDQSEPPQFPDENMVYYLLKGCPNISDQAVAHTSWTYLWGTWVPYKS